MIKFFRFLEEKMGKKIPLSIIEEYNGRFNKEEGYKLKESDFVFDENVRYEMNRSVFSYKQEVSPYIFKKNLTIYNSINLSKSKILGNLTISRFCSIKSKFLEGLEVFGDVTILKVNGKLIMPQNCIIHGNIYISKIMHLDPKLSGKIITSEPNCNFSYNVSFKEMPNNQVFSKPVILGLPESYKYTIIDKDSLIILNNL